MIIGLVGKARAGKDTFAEYLSKIFLTDFDIEFLRLAFADELKCLCMEHFGLTYEQLWGNKKEVEDSRFVKSDGSFLTAREILQMVGEFYRSIDNDFWVKKVAKTIGSGDKNFIITDIRYVNEAKYIKSKHGILIKIIRNSAPEIHGANHISEVSVDFITDDVCDFIIYNDYDLKYLYRTAISTARLIVNHK